MKNTRKKMASMILIRQARDTPCQRAKLAPPKMIAVRRRQLIGSA
jgi:hypothetical protein